MPSKMEFITLQTIVYPLTSSLDQSDIACHDAAIESTQTPLKYMLCTLYVYMHIRGEIIRTLVMFKKVHC